MSLVKRYFTEEETTLQDVLDSIEYNKRDVVVTNSEGEEIFRQNGVEAPVFWSDTAVRVVTGKYFSGVLGKDSREYSVKQLITRVVRKISQWGVEDGYLGTLDESEDDPIDIFEAELAHAVLHQYASFNSPVWFNLGIEGVPQQISACQPYDALVSTPSGPTPIGKLTEDDAVGMLVYDSKGTTRVLATKENGIRELLRIRMKSGHILDVTPDHLVWRSSGAGTGRFIPAGDLVEDDKLEWCRHKLEMVEDGSDVQVAEAALAGWLQADGFVGQYTGTNKSLTIEAMTVNADEHAWVSHALDVVFPHIHRKETKVVTQDTKIDCWRIRLYGNGLEDFVQRWELRPRGVDMQVPGILYTSPLPVVAAYLKSLFQADGYVSVRERTTLIGLGMISRGLIEGVQVLLSRFGIFSRVCKKVDKRSNRYDMWTLHIQSLGDRCRFTEYIGFVSIDKVKRLAFSLMLMGRDAFDTKRLEIASIESIGSAQVYDIQTASGEYLSGGLRVHNCFILSIEDSMESILDVAKTEGMIFKRGSGAGKNLSTLRSSRETVADRSTSSGPVSFMRGFDAFAGVIKSGSKARRAAKMEILNVEHPDILDFIRAKVREEDKAAALVRAGYDPTIDGEAYGSVFFQNSNLSVRVTDEFMEKALKRETYTTKYVKTGEDCEILNAGEVLDQISEAAWRCGDPGVQYDDTIQSWHTCSNTGPITASNPCSEYMSLDDSACNLVSINLLKFLTQGEDGRAVFDLEKFRHVVRLFILAQDAMVASASYPTERIATTARSYRQLGLGYANLGALLMSLGLPYGSDEGRRIGGAVTSLITALGYEMSTDLAEMLGPYDGYKLNSSPQLAVMARHDEKNGEMLEICPSGSFAAPIFGQAEHVWNVALSQAQLFGCRNSQISLLAPTGTIAFMMDCDTTGIEPELALVKYKRLVGGGTIKSTNRVVKDGLIVLGYDHEQVLDIVDYVDRLETIEGAPHLKEEHLPVFDCSLAPTHGVRLLDSMSHLRMMAVVQPFVSGAISKTVNLPSDATVEDIREIYIEGWKLGLKAVAVYRNGCKESQPMEVGKKTEDEEEPSQPMVQRRRLPEERPSLTHKFEINGHEGYLTLGFYPDTKQPGEIFIEVAKEGSSVSGMMDTIATLTSIGLQYGVPPEVFVRKFAHTRFEPSGFTKNKDIPIAKSIVDYVFRWLGLKVGIKDIAGVRGEEFVPEDGSQADAVLCPECGTLMQRSGQCHRCPECGMTTGCS